MFEWFQRSDVELFRFVNGTLSNPLFDKLMPFVSGNVFFVPALVILGIVFIWKGRERALICALMVGLVVGTGDGLICRTIKHAVQRPRPYEVLPDVRRPGSKRNRIYDKVEPHPPGGLESDAQKQRHSGKPESKGIVPSAVRGLNTNSMPSAHAANWFAATMVALVYYRRSVWLMLPIACVVSFSRIYNGVHYPSDVLVGAIIGAGHAAAVLCLLEWLWRSRGRKWFPQWFETMPSLISITARSKDHGSNGRGLALGTQKESSGDP